MGILLKHCALFALILQGSTLWGVGAKVSQQQQYLIPLVTLKHGNGISETDSQQIVASINLSKSYDIKKLKQDIINKLWGSEASYLFLNPPRQRDPKKLASYAVSTSDELKSALMNNNLLLITKEAADFIKNSEYVNDKAYEILLSYAVREEPLKGESEISRLAYMKVPLFLRGNYYEVKERAEDIFKQLRTIFTIPAQRELSLFTVKVYVGQQLPDVQITSLEQLDKALQEGRVGVFDAEAINIFNKLSQPKERRPK